MHGWVIMIIRRQNNYCQWSICLETVPDITGVMVSLSSAPHHLVSSGADMVTMVSSGADMVTMVTTGAALTMSCWATQSSSHHNVSSTPGSWLGSFQDVTCCSPMLYVYLLLPFHQHLFGNSKLCILEYGLSLVLMC